MVDTPIIRRPTVAELLAESGVDLDAARAALVAHDDEGGESPWAIRALVGFGAWLSALILIVLALALEVGQGGAGIFLGLVAIGCGLALRRTAGPGSIFRAQFALCLSLAGHGLTIGIIADSSGIIAGALALVVLGGLSLVLMPDPVHRFLSTAGVVLGLTALLFDAFETPWMLHATLVPTALGMMLLFEREAGWQAGPWADLHLPVGFGLAASAAALSIPAVMGELGAGRSLAGAALVLLMVVCADRIARSRGIGLADIARDRRGIAIAALVVGGLVVGQASPGVIAAALAMTLGLHRGHPVLFGGAALFFVGFLVTWYAQMDLTLFVKAGALAGAGALALLARMALRGAGGSK